MYGVCHPVKKYIMQRIAVFGGTGMTGQCVVDYALQKGLKVHLLYRSESTVPERFLNNENIQMIKGDALNIEDCEKVLKDTDGACIILGTRNKLDPTTDMSTGTANVIGAMKKLNLRKFSVIMSSFLFRSDDSVPPIFKNINDDHKRMLELTKKSDLDFVAILPPHISDEPPSEHVIKENEGPGRMISKLDLAKFTVESLYKPEYYGKVWGLAKVGS